MLKLTSVVGSLGLQQEKKVQCYLLIAAFVEDHDKCLSKLTSLQMLSH